MLKSNVIRRRAQAVAVSLLVGGSACLPLAVATAGATPSPAAPVANHNITEAEVLAAQKAWGDALLQIGRDFETGGHAKAKATAEAIIDAAYGYQYGPVLFKPTMAAPPQTFRTTKEGALAYFVGQNPNYPADKGFALMGWRAVEIRNAAIQLSGQTAVTTGNVLFTDKNGKVTMVDKTWGYMRDDQGRLRITLHHSSLPAGT